MIAWFPHVHEGYGRMDIAASQVTTRLATDEGREFSSKAGRLACASPLAACRHVARLSVLFLMGEHCFCWQALRNDCWPTKSGSAASSKAYDPSTSGTTSLVEVPSATPMPLQLGLQHAHMESRQKALGLLALVILCGSSGYDEALMLFIVCAPVTNTLCHLVRPTHREQGRDSLPMSYLGRCVADEDGEADGDGDMFYSCDDSSDGDSSSDDDDSSDAQPAGRVEATGAAAWRAA